MKRTSGGDGMEDAAAATKLKHGAVANTVATGVVVVGKNVDETAADGAGHGESNVCIVSPELLVQNYL